MRLGALVPRPNPPPRLWRPGVRDAAPTGSGDMCQPGRLCAREARRRGRETDRCRQRRRSTVPGEWGGGCRGGRCRLPARAPGTAAHSPPAPARLPRAEPRSCEASATPPCGPGPGTGAAVRVSREGARVCLRESVSVAVCVHVHSRARVSVCVCARRCFCVSCRPCECASPDSCPRVRPASAPAHPARLPCPRSRPAARPQLNGEGTEPAEASVARASDCASHGLSAQARHTDWAA